MIPNPVNSGYFADPAIVKDKGRYFIYATIDPWGDKELAVLETTDFINFSRKHINWPKWQYQKGEHQRNTKVQLIIRIYKI